jgi:hypothetical protein
MAFFPVERGVMRRLPRPDALRAHARRPQQPPHPLVAERRDQVVLAAVRGKLRHAPDGEGQPALARARQRHVHQLAQLRGGHNWDAAGRIGRPLERREPIHVEVGNPVVRRRHIAAHPLRHRRHARPRSRCGHDLVPPVQPRRQLEVAQLRSEEPLLRPGERT